MNLLADFNEWAEKKVAALPKGSIATYIGPATITLRKVGPNDWELVSVDSGLRHVTDGYITHQNPMLNEETVL
jgi:hypothetical protein